MIGSPKGWPEGVPVIIEWVDSFGCASNWAPVPEKAPGTHTCFSAGWIVAEDEESIVVVPHVSPENEEIGAELHGCGDMTIPRCAVKGIWEIKGVRKRE